MNKNTGIIIGIVAVIAIVGAVYASNNKDNTVTEKNMDDSAMMEKHDDTMMKDETIIKNDEMKEDEMVKKEETGMVDEMMKKEETGMEEGTMEKSAVMMKGSYEAYAPEKLAKAETGDVVLFFHASWCPSCRALNSDIEANVSLIPEAVSILKVDYDKETALKQKYGVTTQHTLVQVDKDGNLLKKWSGSPELSDLISKIQ